MMNKWPFVCLLSLALGIGIGWGVRGADSHESSAAAPSGDRSFDARLAIAPSALSAADQEHLGMIVRAECGSALKSELSRVESNRSVVPAAVAATKPATSEKLEQRSAALAEIDALLNSSQISAEDRGRFHADLAALDPQQRAEALNRFGSAVSNGRIKSLPGSVEP